MGAALALAQALGVNALIAAELLPEIEAVTFRHRMGIGLAIAVLILIISLLG